LFGLYYTIIYSWVHSVQEKLIKRGRAVYKSELPSPMQCIEPTISICLTRPSFRFTSLSRASFIHQCWQTSLASETLIYTHKKWKFQTLSYWSFGRRNKKKYSNTMLNYSMVFSYLPIFFDEHSVLARTPIALEQVEGTCSLHKMYHGSCSWNSTYPIYPAHTKFDR